MHNFFPNAVSKILPRLSTWVKGSTESPTNVTSISGQDNNYPSDEKSLQEAPNLLVKKILEKHNLTFILVWGQTQQSGSL